MDSNEVSFFHEKGIAILVIYNHVNDVTGYDHGVEHAETAIQMAEELDIPEDVAIFLNVEPEYPIDSAFLEAWYETVNDSNYHPAVYGVFDEGSHLDQAFQSTDEEIQENTIVWTAYPQEGVTTKDNAPEFTPEAPENAMHVGWQYGLDAETCNIDTNLIQGEIMDYLWQE